MQRFPAWDLVVFLCISGVERSCPFVFDLSNTFCFMFLLFLTFFKPELRRPRASCFCLSVFHKSMIFGSLVIEIVGF